MTHITYKLTQNDLELYRQYLAGSMTNDNFLEKIRVDGMNKVTLDKYVAKLDAWHALQENPLNIPLLFNAGIFPTRLHSGLKGIGFSSYDLCHLPRHLKTKNGGKYSTREGILLLNGVRQGLRQNLEEICDALGIILPWDPQYDPQNTNARKTAAEAALVERFLINDETPPHPSEPTIQTLPVSKISEALAAVAKGKTVILTSFGNPVARLVPLDEPSPGRPSIAANAAQFPQSRF